MVDHDYSMPTRFRRRVLVWLVATMAFFGMGPDGLAQEPRDDSMRGLFVEVRSPITSAVTNSIKRKCEEAINPSPDGARRESVRTIIFHLRPGKSDFGNCLNLANYIEELGGAKTVCYISESLAGHSAMIALSCDELVMKADAKLGEIARDEAFIRPELILTYRELAKRRHPDLQALIVGLVDPEVAVWKIVTQKGTRYVLDEELDQQQQVVRKTELIAAGQTGEFSGEDLKQIGMVRLIAPDRVAVAEAYGLSAKLALQDATNQLEWKPVIVRIEGMVNPVMAEFAKRHIKEEIAGGKNFIILEIDSLGGFVYDGLGLAQFLRDLENVKTVAYVPEKAISAAAFIALGCDEIVIGSGAKFGDCGVWFMDGAELSYLEGKQLSIIFEDLRSLAEARGHSKALVRSLVDQDLVVKEVRDRTTGRISYLSTTQIEESKDKNIEVLRTVKEKGTFLTVDGRTAHGLGIATEVVDNIEGMLAVYGLDGVEPARVKQNWVDGLVWFLNRKWVGWMLVVIGIISLYVELKIPGVGLPLVISSICFLLFFWSRFLGGTATALEVVLFLGGVVLIGFEVFVIPGVGAFGVSGAILVIASLVLASQTFLVPVTAGQWNDLESNIGHLIIAVLGVFGLGFLVTKYLPDVPILGRVVLMPEPVLAGESERTFGDTAIAFIGMEGTAYTPLRPAGRMKVADRLIDVVTQGGFVDEGATLRVVELSGNRVVVEQAT